MNNPRTAIRGHVTNYNNEPCVPSAVFGLWFRAEGFDHPPTDVAPGAAYLRFGIGHTLAFVLILFYILADFERCQRHRNLAAEKGRFLLRKLGYMGLFAQFAPGTPLWDRRLPARTLLSMKH